MNRGGEVIVLWGYKRVVCVCVCVREGGRREGKTMSKKKEVSERRMILESGVV